MKNLALALLTVCLLAAPLVGADNSATSADVDRPPNLFYTPDTLLMARIDLGSITGPDLHQTLRGMFSNKTWAMMMEDKFTAGILQLGEVVAAAYEKEFRHPFEAKGGSSVWVVSMSGGADNRVFLLVRLGHGLGMKPAENFEEWINTKGGADHMVGLAKWVQGLEPKRLMGVEPKPGEPKSMDFTKITRVGQYLVCRKPGTPLPTAEQYDPTALLAFTKALHIGSRQRVAWALLPHKRWRDDVAKNLKKAQEEVDKKKAKGKAAGLGEVKAAEMMLGVLNSSQWVAGWVQTGNTPSTAVVVRANTEQAAAKIETNYDNAVAATYTLAALYDGKAMLRDFLSENRNKRAKVSYGDFAQTMIRALKIKRKGPLIGLVLENSEILQLTEATAVWEKQQRELKKEQEEEDKRKREEERERRRNK